METKRAVFFDRDGVIFPPVEWEGENKTRAPFSYQEFLDAGGVVSSAEAVIRAVRDSGFLAILVTNQPDVGYGHLSKEEWERIHAHARALPFDDEFVCFHGRDDGCECKKPKPGMLLAAAKKWDIDLATSYFVGDTEADTGAARAAGCRSILVDTPYNSMVVTDFRVHSLCDIAALIRQRDRTLTTGAI